jgi:hypothetical protein
VLQTVREALGAPHGEVRTPGRDLGRDREELGLQPDTQPTTAPTHERLEPPDGLVEAPEGVRKLGLPGPEPLEGDDLTHAATIATPSDTALTSEADLVRAYATRTDVTGASRSAAPNQVFPPSPDPNTSPDVAPKYSSSPSPSPPAPKACR